MFERSDEQPSWVGALAPGTRWMRYPFAADVVGLCPVGSPAFDVHAQQALDWATGVTKQKAPDLIISVAGHFEARSSDPAKQGVGLAGVCGVRANGERMVGLSLDNPTSVLDNVLHHELVHFLRRGYLHESEWSSLASASQRHDWRRHFDIARRYPNVSTDRGLEESIADTYAWWRQVAGGGSRSDRGRAWYSRPSDPSRLIIPGRAERLFHDIENGIIGNRSWDADLAAHVAVLDAETPMLAVPPPATGPPNHLHQQFRVGASNGVPPALRGQALVQDDGVRRAGGISMSQRIYDTTIGGTDLEMAMRVSSMEGAPPLLKAAASLAVRTSFHKTSNYDQAQEVWRSVSALYASGKVPDAQTVERYATLIERMNGHPQLVVASPEPRSIPVAGVAAGAAGVGLTAVGVGASQSGAFDSSLLDSVTALATRGLDAAAVAIGQKPPDFTSDPSAWLQWQLDHVGADDPLADIAAKGSEAASQLWSATTNGAEEARKWLSEVFGQTGAACDAWRNGPTPPLPFSAPTADTLPLSSDALAKTDGEVGQFVENLKLSPPPDGHAMIIERLQELWDQIKDWVAAQFSNNDVGTQFGSLIDQASTALHQVAASDMVQSALHAVSTVQFSTGQQALNSPGGLTLETTDRDGAHVATPIESFAAASALVRRSTREAVAAGAADIGPGAVIRDAGGRDVARVTKEGVVWPAAFAPNRQPLYDPKHDPDVQKKAAAVMVLVADAIATDDRSRLGGIIKAVDPDMGDKFGRTMAHVVAQSGPAWAIDMLGKAGADLNARTNWGSTPLAYAASGNNAAAIVALRSHGADPALADNRGRKPVDLSRDDAVRTLLDGATQYRVPAPGEGMRVGFALHDSADQRRRYAELTEKAWHEKPRELSVETGVIRPIVVQKVVSTDTHGIVQGEAVGPVKQAARQANIPVIEDKKRPELGIAVPLDGGETSKKIALLTGREIVVMQHDDDRRQERGRSEAMDRFLAAAKQAAPYAAAALGAIGAVAIGAQKLGGVQFRLATAQTRDVAQTTLLVGANSLSETAAIRQRASLLAEKPITIALTRADDGPGRLVMGLTFETREAAEKAAEALAIGGYRCRVLAEPNAGDVVRDAPLSSQQASVAERGPSAWDESHSATPRETKSDFQDIQTAPAPHAIGAYVREAEGPLPPAREPPLPGSTVNTGEILHSGKVHHVGTLDVRVVPDPQGTHVPSDTGGAGWLRPVDVARIAVAGAASLLGTAAGHAMFKTEGSDRARTQPVLVEGGRQKIRDAASGLRALPPEALTAMALVTKAYADAPSTPPDMAAKAQNGLQALAQASRPASVARSRLAGGAERGGM